MLPKVFLEITSACNLACPFCPPTARKAVFMSREDFALFLGRLGPGSTTLYFHVKGEPLLHPELGAFLGMALERGLGVSLTTNGSLVGERAALLLASPGLRKLSISLHSHVGLPGPDAHGALSSYWRGLEVFLDAYAEERARREGLGLHKLFAVSLRLWNREGGEPEPATRELAALMGARWPRLDLEAATRSNQGTRLEEGVYLNPAERFAWPDPALPEIARTGSCHGLGNQVAILVDGSVVPCCLDGEGLMRLGNLHEASLDEILATPRALAIREGFRRGILVEELCRRCGYRTRFPPKGARKDSTAAQYSSDPDVSL